MWRALVLLSGMSLTPAVACKCLVQYGACQETATVEAVFTGTVVKVEPRFLDPYHSREVLAGAPVAEMSRLEEEATPAGLSRRKEIYLGLFADVDKETLGRIANAESHAELSRVFHTLVTEGVRTTFRGRKAYKLPKDDDDDNTNDDTNDDTMVVWTDTGECGIPFQKGETYLVYADGDEETGRLQTSRCYRTRRVTDAGEDLAYLSFYEDEAHPASRVEGFVTSNPRQDWPKDVARVESPVQGVTVGLSKGDDTRFIETDGAGYFVFDGVSMGDYELGLFRGTLERGLQAAAPAVRVAVGKERGCVQKVLLGNGVR